MDPAHLLWEDRAPHELRFEKSAAALVAVARALRDDPRVPGASAFLESYPSAANALPEHFSRVWRDPSAYHWVRRAVHLLAARRGAPLSRFERAYCEGLGAVDPEDALGRHLPQFAKFALGFGLVAGHDIAFAMPYETALPLAIPGTDLALVGSGRVAIAGLSSGEIEIVDDGGRRHLPRDANAPPAGPRIERCPAVDLGDARVVLNPYVFQLPGLGLPHDLTVPGRDAATLVAETMRVLERFHPTAYGHFAHAIQVVALKRVHEGDFGTLSNSELPGAFICSLPSDPFALAADFIHEAYHHRLFAIEEAGPFFGTDGEDAIDGELHYSPWRDAPRPLHGVLHAVYVYLPVFRFWSATYRADAHDGARRDHVRDQLARIPFQLRIGVNQLRRHARFTPRGATLFETIAAEASRIEEAANRLGATLDTTAVTLRASGAFQAVVGEPGRRPLTVGETLLAHLTAHDASGECAEERALLRQCAGPR